MTTQKDEILARACDLYLERGLEGFSMRRLADEVGVTAPALYRHFDGKEDVLLAVVGEAYKVMYDYLRRALSGETPAERFQMASEAYVDFALDQPRYYQMIHGPLETMGLDTVPEELEAEACAVRQFWHDRLRECIGAGIIRDAGPESIALTMWSHAHGMVSLYLRGMLGEMDEEAFREIYRSSALLVLEGIAEDGEEAFRAGAADPSEPITEALS